MQLNDQDICIYDDVPGVFETLHRYTSSMATGNFVAGASYNSVGVGTAARIAPAAHITMYKVCGDESCNSSDILASLDEAIKDGVDSVSVSLGGQR
ncbi:hypothetical protein QYE76_064138 [Lolium multiflorum]|uniref:Peptidase S8/S53 domain-containing protein n=1 Tax=Lolium multiflorum TaxID=4521 RepID=A0AAD8S7R8_LOLMU|nr:hypothetical protein QYE76_064138 [Lolium multiflorum]